MKAEDVRLVELLQGPKQFIVPVFQRDYSWGPKQCLRLWDDVLRVGADPNTKAHFVGSIVYVAAEDTSANITRWLVIDGQQRLTTLTLLLAALRDQLPPETAGDHEAIDSDSLPSRAELDDYYLRNTHGKGDRRHKLQLRRADHSTLTALMDGKESRKDGADRLRENYRLFKDRLGETDLNLVYRGIRKLVAVDVHLTRGQDDPQMIFESLNSTGLDLTQADLIRNFVLMRQDEAMQTQLYTDHWQPIEVAFGGRYRSEFDKFVRDYLTLQLRPTTHLKADEIYQHFRRYFYGASAAQPVTEILAELHRFGGYYAAFSLGQEPRPTLREPLRRLRLLVEVAAPVVLKLYDCHDRAGTLPIEDFIEAVELLESYVFRRSVCGMQTRSLGQIFASLSLRIRDDSPLESLAVALHRLGKKRRFPSDAEFREALETRDVYDMRHCHYLLDRLENDSKERIETSSLTIEHIMPQNEELSSEWREELGPDWEAIHPTWLHRLGNITLTGYNTEYSDRPFAEKKAIRGGFNDSPLRLNRFVREQSVWSAAQMESRGRDLASASTRIWPTLVADVDSVRNAELEERRIQAARYSLKDLDFDSESRSLFELLRPQILALGSDVVELCSEKSVTYRVYDFFLEVLPRKRRLSLVLNLEFEECDDPTQHAVDATEKAFIANAAEAGGVLFRLEAVSQVDAAMHLIRQAYERVSE